MSNKSNTKFPTWTPYFNGELLSCSDQAVQLRAVHHGSDIAVKHNFTFMPNSIDIPPLTVWHAPIHTTNRDPSCAPKPSRHWGRPPSRPPRTPQRPCEACLIGGGPVPTEWRCCAAASPVSSPCTSWAPRTTRTRSRRPQSPTPCSALQPDTSGCPGHREQRPAVVSRGPEVWRRAPGPNPPGSRRPLWRSGPWKGGARGKFACGRQLCKSKQCCLNGG